jgi:hypothetical protein
VGSIGGGTRMDPINAEYVTSMERKMDCRAGRRSGKFKSDSVEQVHDK